jgi:hypothetical protein
MGPQNRRAVVCLKLSSSVLFCHRQESMRKLGNWRFILNGPQARAKLFFLKTQRYYKKYALTGKARTAVLYTASP